MEAFEHIVKVFLESKGYIVTTNVKFPVKRRTRKKSRIEYQVHGYEVDIVAAKSNSLLLGSVKSFFGSKGVSKQGFKGIADTSKKTQYDGYIIFNEPGIRQKILKIANERYGHQIKQIKFCLFVGKFAKGHEDIIISHLNNNEIEVYTLQKVVDGLIEYAKSKTYINDPVLVTIKALQHLKRVKE